MKRAILKAAGVIALGSIGLVGLVGLAHTPWGRPLLALLPSAPGCPVQDLGPRELEARRIAWARRRAGTSPSPARPALGFELGVSRKRDVQAWLDRHGATCSSARHETALACKMPHDAYFQFDPQGHLVAVDVLREPRSAVEALALLGEVEHDLSNKVGTATSARGQRSAAFLANAPYRQLALEYRYTDYVGRVSATNLGSRGLRVREQYQWFPSKSGA
jgi:hypothetical protein